MKEEIKFSDLDYKIIKFVLKKKSATVEEIEQSFPKTNNVKYRVEQLSKPMFSDRLGALISDSSPLKKDDIRLYEYAESVYIVTDYGKKLLEDYELDKRNHIKEMWVKNAWIPIIVAFATTLLTNYLLPRLLHLLKLLIHTL